MVRAHKIRLSPNNKQVTFFLKACGVGRVTYNWALEEWSRQYKEGGKPRANELKKSFNQIRKERFPWMAETHRDAYSQPFANLDKAFSKFFKKTAKYPRFKKKGCRDSFYISNDKVQIKARHIRIPKLGWVRMRESLRFEGKLLSVVVSRAADCWFASVSVQMPDASICENQVDSCVGIDLGVAKLATLSDGTVYENAKNTKVFEKRLRRLNKSLARKTKGSENWKKAKLKLSKLHAKIKNKRVDNIHKMTTAISKRYSVVCMEDLHTKGMLKNHKLAKAIADASFREIRRQLEYKADRVYLVDRFFPSTKLCMECGQLHDMPLSKRVFTCDCGAPSMDRDLHASQNILRECTAGFAGT